MKLKEIITYLDNFAPETAQETWDNSGLQLGDYNQDVQKIVLALDADSRALDYCLKTGADLLITHHPLLFKAVKSINYSVPENKIITDFLKNNISVYSLHTNIDKVPWGTNYALAQSLGLENYLLEEPLFPEFDLEFKNLNTDFKNQYKQKISGFVALAELTDERFKLVENCQNVFQTKVSTNFANNAEVHMLALSGGSFDRDWLEKIASSKIDTIITGEMKYHDQLYCRERNIAVISLGHDVSEDPVLNTFAYLLKLLNINLNTQNPQTSAAELEILTLPRLEYSKLWL